MKVQKKLQLVLLIIISAWLVIIFHEFLFPRNSVLNIFGFYFDELTSYTCHQEPAKLIEYKSYKSSVCSRCSGIYSGVFIGSSLLLISFSPKMKNKYLFYTLLFLLVDVIAVNFGIYTYQKSLAFISGFFLGCVTFFYLYEALEKLISNNKPD